MFDLRYHVASLAAVFIALIIGILVGVGIADRGLLDKGTRRLLEDRITVLQNRLDATAQRTVKCHCSGMSSGLVAAIRPGSFLNCSLNRWYACSMVS